MKKKLLPLPVIAVMILILSSSTQEAAATTTIVLNSSTCVTPLGGTWNSGTGTCTITSFTITSGTTLTINSGVTLKVTGTLTINSGGTINNNSGGTINNNSGGTINNNSGGTINNNAGGTINNNSGGTINNSGTINNAGTINNNSGGVINNLRGLITHGGSIFNSGIIKNYCIAAILDPIKNISGGTVNQIPCLAVSITATPSLPIHGSLVHLKASAVGGFNPYTYQWILISAPAGSHATLSSNTAQKPTFTPDQAGNYKFGVEVIDSFSNFANTQTTIHAN